MLGGCTTLHCPEEEGDVKLSSLQSFPLCLDLYTFTIYCTVLDAKLAAWATFTAAESWCKRESSLRVKKDKAIDSDFSRYIIYSYINFKN